MILKILISLFSLASTLYMSAQDISANKPFGNIQNDFVEVAT